MQSHEPRGRILIFLSVLFSHCVLIFMIRQWNVTQKPATQSFHEPLYVFFIDPITPKTQAGGVIEPSSSKARTVLTHPNAVRRASFPKAVDPDAVSSNAITDWYAQAHNVAEDALQDGRNNASKRAFEHKMPPGQENEPTSIFDPLPVRRAGTWDGPSRFYITDNCYYEWDPAPRPPPTLLDNHLKTPVCKPPPKGGGDVMFKDLIPNYLRKLEEQKDH